MGLLFQWKRGKSLRNNQGWAGSMRFDLSQHCCFMDFGLPIVPSLEGQATSSLNLEKPVAE
jgi:hypothetical protein